MLMTHKLAVLLLLLLCIVLLVRGNESDQNSKRWGAVVVTLAGTKKLSEYFEWSCRSIGSSADSFDMLVFHEGNTKLKNIYCAKNVKFVDLGENGLAKLVVSQVLGVRNTSSEDNRGVLTSMLSDIITHIPRYLVEIKPMTGSLFKDWLNGYSHWTYTDPDIIWGNLTSWLDVADAKEFDVVTLAKTMDAGRLFVRGQFALHRNHDSINHLWKGLEYFSPEDFAKRMGVAVRRLKEKQSSDYIFAENFNSAEGFYSEVVFSSDASVKIIGRGFDDFNSDPVIITKGLLMRCKFEMLQKCMEEANTREPFDVYSLPMLEPLPAPSFHHINACYMQWLPISLRYCIAKPRYNKDTALVQDKQDSLRLERVGEAFTDGIEPGSAPQPQGYTETRKWLINNERAARRQTTFGAFFHFRHWDDYASVSMSTTWGENADPESLGCMVLYLRSDKVMAFEDCNTVSKKVDEALANEVEKKGYFEPNQKTKVEEEKESLALLEARALGRSPQLRGGHGGAVEAKEKDEVALQLAAVRRRQEGGRHIRPPQQEGGTAEGESSGPAGLGGPGRPRGPRGRDAGHAGGPKEPLDSPRRRRRPGGQRADALDGDGGSEAGQGDGGAEEGVAGLLTGAAGGLVPRGDPLHPRDDLLPAPFRRRSRMKGKGGPRTKGRPARGGGGGEEEGGTGEAGGLDPVQY